MIRRRCDGSGIRVPGLWFLYARATRQGTAADQPELEDRVGTCSSRRFRSSGHRVSWLLTLPGVGLTLAVVIALEVGDVTRFATAEKLASYAGTTPRVHASGGGPDSVPRAPTSTATSSGPTSKRRTRSV